MSLPNPVVPGTTYFITRSIVLQYFLLRPDKEMANLIYYALAYAALLHKIDVHALCAMSNHLHLIVTDTLGVLPDFLRDFHRLVAMGTRKLRKWNRPVFEKEPTNRAILGTPAGVVEKIAYVLANPVAAGLVEHADEWPGAKTLLADLGRGVIKATRPKFYFSAKNSQWPKELELKLTVPPTVDQDDVEKFQRMVGEELKRAETTAHEEMRRQGRRFLGAKRAMMISPTDHAMNEKSDGELNPKFAVGRGNSEALKALIEERRAFIRHYRDALAKWRAGDRDVVFPPGTWWMRVFHKVKTASDPPVAA